METIDYKSLLSWMNTLNTCRHARHFLLSSDDPGWRRLGFMDETTDTWHVVPIYVVKSGHPRLAELLMTRALRIQLIEGKLPQGEQLGNDTPLEEALRELREQTKDPLEEALQAEALSGANWEGHKITCSECHNASWEEELCETGKDLQRSWEMCAKAVQGDDKEISP